MMCPCKQRVYSAGGQKTLKAYLGEPTSTVHGEGLPTLSTLHQGFQQLLCGNQTVN